MLKIIVQFLLILVVNLQYQHCSFLSGTGEVGTEGHYEIKGEYSQENSIGGVGDSASFLTSNDTELMVFFGLNYDSGYYFDKVWKYSILKKQWMFLKGRESISSARPIFQETNVFSSEIEIGARFGTLGWKNKEIITFFGGNCHLKEGVFGDLDPMPANELWRYNISDNTYLVNRYNYYNGELDHNSFSTFETANIYGPLNVPSGRKYFSLTKIDEDEVFLLGGYGFTQKSTAVDYWNTLADCWKFSSLLMEWKYIHGKFSSSKIYDSFFSGINVYNPSNRIGSISGHDSVLVNSEEILILGGDSRIKVYKFNLTSNEWKYVWESDSQFGIDRYYSKGFKREYNLTNYIGAREYHKAFRINEQEILIYGGYGGGKDSGYGTLSDSWHYHIEENLFRFSGKEDTKYKNRYSNFPILEGNEFSDDTIAGGRSNFVGQYLKERNEIIICNGNGYEKYAYGYLDSCFVFYLGNMCNLLKENDPEVCLQRGNCYSHNKCDCKEGYFGDYCELTKCNDILSNETDLVCSKKGICVDSRCLCYEQSAYNNVDCTINEELKQIMTNLWIYITVPIVVVVLLLLILFSTIIFILICMKQKNRLKKMDGIEDVDLILNEARMEQSSTTPKIKLNKALFEIEYEDIQLKSIIGEGGSNSVCFLCQWKGNYCVYKSLKINNGTTDDINSQYLEFEKEVKMYTSIHHPSILQFFGACINPPHVGLILQYCQFGDIPSFLNRYVLKHKKKYDIHKKINLIYEIALGLEYLHSVEVIHRDLKPENVLVDDNEHSKIMDFGLSRITSNEEKTMTKKIGTSYYMAPEVYNSGKYTNKCDVYSFAILIYVMITENYFPFGTTSELRTLQKISSRPNFRPELEKENFKECNFLVPLIKKNWNHDPKQRNSFKEIVKSLAKQKKNIEIIKKERNGKELNENISKEKLLQQIKTLEEKLKKEKEKNASLLKSMKKSKNV